MPLKGPREGRESQVLGREEGARGGKEEAGDGEREGEEAERDEREEPREGQVQEPLVSKSWFVDIKGKKVKKIYVYD